MATSKRSPWFPALVFGAIWIAVFVLAEPKQSS
jgi:hypothetical protein